MDTKIFQADAKTIVDMAFDNKLFKDHLTRDDFDSFEELLCFMLQSRFESYQKVEKLLNKVDRK